MLFLYKWMLKRFKGFAFLFETLQQIYFCPKYIEMITEVLG